MKPFPGIICTRSMCPYTAPACYGCEFAIIQSAANNPVIEIAQGTFHLDFSGELTDLRARLAAVTAERDEYQHRLSDAVKELQQAQADLEQAQAKIANMSHWLNATNPWQESE